MIQQEDLTPADKQAVEEFRQFLKWAGFVMATHDQAPLRHLACYWYDGLMTVDEGQRIETGKQVWQEA